MLERFDDAVFADRRDAGRRLAAALEHLRARRPLVLALPRGGVPVAFEVAQALDAPLDLVLVRKIGAPGFEELALAAVVDGSPPLLHVNEALVAEVRPPPGWIESQMQQQLRQIERRRRLYRGDRPPPQTAGRCVILVDDGIATGATMRAALRALRAADPARLVVAVPVAPPETVRELQAEADEVVCLLAPRQFGAVGAFYEDFGQTSDEEVVALLAQAQRRHRADGAASE